MDIVQKILEQIAHHRAELLKLESALEVIASVGDKSAAKAAQAPLITIRRTGGAPQLEHAPEKKPPLQRQIYALPPAKIDAEIIAYLNRHGPSPSRDIGAAIKGVDSKRLWSRLWHMNKEGSVVRDGKIYRLPQQAENSAAA